MVLVALPDHVGALVLRLKGQGDIAALVGTRVGDRLRPEFGELPYWGIVVGARGVVPGAEFPLLRSRVDVECYAPKYMHDAQRLARMVVGYLCGYDGSRTAWTMNHCRVYDVALEGGPNPVPEESKGFPRAIATFLVLHGSVPA